MIWNVNADLSRAPLAWLTTLVTLLDLFLHLITELRIGVFFLGRHV